MTLPTKGLALEPGQELDTYLAEHLFGYVWLTLPTEVTLVKPREAKAFISRYGDDAFYGKSDKPLWLDFSVEKWSTTWQGMEMVIKAVRALPTYLQCTFAEEVQDLILIQNGKEPGRKVNALGILMELEPGIAALAAARTLAAEDAADLPLRTRPVRKAGSG